MNRIKNMMIGGIFGLMILAGGWIVYLTHEVDILLSHDVEIMQQVSKSRDNEQFIMTQILDMLTYRKVEDSIIRSYQEDYPLKKKLGDRTWCKDRTCLN